MTFIHSQKENFKLNKFIAILTVSVVVAACLLILFYNRNVNLSHAMLEAREETQLLEAKNAEFKEQIFRALNTAELEQTILNRGLVKEKTPTYITVSNQWASASHR